MFGPSTDEVWRKLSDEIGGEFVDGGAWKTDMVTVHVDPWILTLDRYTISTGKTTVTFTRMRAPYVNRDGFRFTISRKNLFTGIGKFLGMQDITIGDPAFDEAFVIKANNPSQVTALLSSPRLRELLLQQPGISLSVKDDEGMFGPAFNESVDELYFSDQGVIKDIERLKQLFDLFAETLHQLCHIGSAYESDPSRPAVLPETDVLLRGSSASANPDTLLRPAEGTEPPDSAQLPRASDKP